MISDKTSNHENTRTKHETANAVILVFFREISWLLISYTMFNPSAQGGLTIPQVALTPVFRHTFYFRDLYCEP